MLCLNNVKSAAYKPMGVIVDSQCILHILLEGQPHVRGRVEPPNPPEKSSRELQNSELHVLQLAGTYEQLKCIFVPYCAVRLSFDFTCYFIDA